MVVDDFLALKATIVLIDVVSKVWNRPVGFDVSCVWLHAVVDDHANLPEDKGQWHRLVSIAQIRYRYAEAAGHLECFSGPKKKQAEHE